MHRLRPLLPLPSCASDRCPLPNPRAGPPRPVHSRSRTMANKNWWSKQSGRGKRPTGQPQKRGPGAGAFQGEWVRLLVEQLEPRLAPAVTLKYADITNPPTNPPPTPASLTTGPILSYLAALASTNYTLKA